MISYAQNLEDVLLARAFRDNNDGFYIDVGAMDPTEGSVTKHFYDLGWHGINIEPDQRFYGKLQAERNRDINLPVAVSEKEETRTFYQFQPQGISTFDPKFREYFEAKGYEATPGMVPMTTLELIRREYVNTEVDFLKIDAEGWEGPILRGADWDNFRPRVIVIEATEPYSHTPRWSEWEPDLINARYLCAYFDGLNRFYIRQEEPQLREAFAFPPNVLDNFTTFATQQVVDERNRLKEQLEESRLWVGRLSQERAAERIRSNRLTEERNSERQRADQLFQESEELRLRTEKLQYERESERQRANLFCDTGNHCFT